MTTYIRTKTGLWTPWCNGTEMGLYTVDTNELYDWARNQRRVFGRTPIFSMRYW